MQFFTNDSDHVTNIEERPKLKFLRGSNDSSKGRSFILAQNDKLRPTSALLQRFNSPDTLCAFEARFAPTKDQSSLFLRKQSSIFLGFRAYVHSMSHLSRAPLVYERREPSIAGGSAHPSPNDQCSLLLEVDYRSFKQSHTRRS